MNQPLPKEFSEWSVHQTLNQSLYCGMMYQKKKLIREADSTRIREHNRKMYHLTKPQTK